MAPGCGKMANGPRSARASRPQRAPAAGIGEKRIPDSYIVILQPTVTPYEMLSSVLKGYKPTFTYGSIFTGFAVDRVPAHKADEVRSGIVHEMSFNCDMYYL